MVTDPNSSTVSVFSDHYEYDVKGYVTKRTFSVAYKVPNPIYPANYHTNFIDGTWTLAYDTSERISQIDITEALGHIQGGIRQTDGLRTSKLTYTYDAEGKIASYSTLATAYPVGAPTQTRRTQTTFIKGVATKYIEVPFGSTTAQEPYDLNAQGLVSTYKYNGKIDTKYTYDQRGNLTKKEYPGLNSVVTMEYDNKPVSDQLADGNALNPVYGGLINGGAKGHPTFVLVGPFNRSPNNLIRETSSELSATGQILSTQYAASYAHTYNEHGFVASTIVTRLTDGVIVQQNRCNYVGCP